TVPSISMLDAPSVSGEHASQVWHIDADTSRGVHSIGSGQNITSAIGHLRPFMPQKTRVGNDRSQSTTDVARRRNRNEKLYKAGARSSVTLAAHNADRRAAVSEIELALSTRCSRSRDREADVR